jgi:hypothetical protein
MIETCIASKQINTSLSLCENQSINQAFLSSSSSSAAAARNTSGASEMKFRVSFKTLVLSILTDRHFNEPIILAEFSVSD